MILRYDSLIVVLITLYGLFAALFGFTLHVLMVKIRKERNAKVETRQVRAAVDAFNRSGLPDSNPEIREGLKSKFPRAFYP